MDGNATELERRPTRRAERKVDHGFRLVGERFEQLDRRLGQVDRRLDQIDTRLERCETAIVKLDERMAQASLTVVVAITVGFLANITAVTVALLAGPG